MYDIGIRLYDPAVDDPKPGHGGADGPRLIKDHSGPYTVFSEDDYEKRRQQKPGATGPCPINVLPNELLFHSIERFLRPTSARLVELQRVCKKWKTMCSDEHAWKRILETEFEFSKCVFF